MIDMNLDNPLERVKARLNQHVENVPYVGDKQDTGKLSGLLIAIAEIDAELAEEDRRMGRLVTSVVDDLDAELTKEAAEASLAVDRVIRAMQGNGRAK